MYRVLLWLVPWLRRDWPTLCFIPSMKKFVFKTRNRY